jgi:tripartite-type tricarboxylate transporter receptor subunit TctC
MLSRRQFGLATSALGLLTPFRGALADSYPSKPVRYVVPFAPGGATDIVARLLSEKLSQKMGQRFYIDNRDGAAGLLGTRLAVQAPPDGYTIVGVSFSFLLYPILFKDLDFNILTDLAPLSQIAIYPSVLVVHPSSPFKSVKDIVEAARKSPDALQFASSGVGTAAHIAGELLNRDAKIKMAHVPYRGGGPANADLVAGHVTMHFANIGSAFEFIKGGLMRPIAVAMPRRIAALPEVPTMIEEGYPGFVINEFQGALTAPHTPPELVNNLSTEIQTVLRDKEMATQFSQMGGEIVASSPAEFAEMIKTDSAKWIAVAKAAGVGAVGQ